MATASSIHAVHAAKQQTRVVVYTATTGPIVEQIHLSGTVNSPKIAQLSSEVSGLVKSFNVDKGSQLERGDVIITLDTELEELSLKAAEASMRSAEAELADARRRLEDGQRLAKQKNISASELKSLQAEVNIVQAYPLILRPHGKPAVALMVEGCGRGDTIMCGFAEVD